MSDYKHYAEERSAVESLLKEGYLIKGMRDNLDGATVVFEKDGQGIERMHVTMADTRKYISNLLMNQLRGA